VARSPSTGSYGKRNTVIITWFGAGKPQVSTRHVQGRYCLKVFKALSYTEEGDANDCRVVMGKMKRYCIGEVT